MPLGEKTKELWKNPEYREHMSKVHMGHKKPENAYTWNKENNPTNKKSWRKWMSKLRMRDGNPMWINGEYIDDNGYKRKITGNHKYTLEHRLVMEKHLGRKLTKKEVVHHIDGDVSNNVIDNLMLFKCKGDHTSHHHKLRKVGGNSG